MPENREDTIPVRCLNCILLDKRSQGGGQVMETMLASVLIEDFLEFLIQH